MAAQLAYPDDQQGNHPNAALSHHNFSSLPLFTGAVRSTPTSKQISAWADAILCYWLRGIANGCIDRTQSLYLLDMAPRDGQASWLMLQALSQRVVAQGLTLSWCYLACYADAASAEQQAAHPYFREWIAAGRIDFGYWNTAHTALHLTQQQIVLPHCTNPLVVIAHGYVQTQPSELFCLHNGQLLAGTVASQIQAGDLADAGNAASGSATEVHHFSYQWTPNQAISPSISESLLAHYRHHCNGAALQLPLAACATFDQLQRFAQGRTLLLAADPGVCTEKQIRLGALCPPASWQLGDAAPLVNFHALSLQQREQGAWVWQQQLDDAGLVVHMAVRDDRHTFTRDDFHAIAAMLVDAHPEDMRQLATTQHSAADTLTLLRLAHYDPQLLKANIAGFIDPPLTLSDSARRNWQQALVHTWGNFLPSTAYDGFYDQVGLMAAHIGHYGLAKECFGFGLAWYGDAATDLYLLAWCEAASGGVTRALELLTCALALEPEHAPSLALCATLQAQLARWQQNHWYLPNYAKTTVNADSTNELKHRALQLEPLSQEHAAALLYQYRDRQIGIMTCLPALDTIEQADEWISKEQQDAARASFAVMHECWGLVGMSSIHCSGDAGYFYFWIGSDFQTQGLGQQAAQLLFEMMAQHGVTEIFTSAYEDNLRSVHTLTRLGFTALPVRALAPDNELRFFHRRGRGNDIAASRAALCDLCAAINSPLAF